MTIHDIAQNMLTPGRHGRRSVLKGVTLGAGSLLFEPLLQKVAAQAAGRPSVPKRAIFFVFDNGFKDDGAVPVDTNLVSNETRQFSLRGYRLPLDIEPFAPFQDRITLLHGMRSHTAVDHGGFFAALSGSSGNKHTPQAESIDAAIARIAPSAFPLLHLGIGGGTTAYCCSAWGRNRPIAAICRPEQAYETLFGNTGATRNDFAARRNLLDFVTDDVRRLRSEIAGPERELVDSHLEAMESLSRRDEQLGEKFDTGTLRRHAPALPARPPQSMTEVTAAQCDIAAAALTAGLTNVVTITAGLCSIPANYSGISDVHPHGIGHGLFDVLSRYHNFLASQAARMLTRLQETREGTGTMLDNTVLVFMSDSANQQHSWKGANWPFVLVGNLGGRLTSGQYLSYPVSKRQTWDAAGQEMGAAAASNPVINALYCTLLHAFGSPRDTFNRSSSAPDEPALYGPLPRLLNT
jgi:hypothetical protein